MHNVFGLGEGGKIEVQKFILAQKLIESTNVKPSTKAPLLPNPCCRKFFCPLKLVHNLKNKIKCQKLQN